MKASTSQWASGGIGHDVGRDDVEKPLRRRWLDLVLSDAERHPLVPNPASATTRPRRQIGGLIRAMPTSDL